ncbi:DUF58 domain-containing protein [bacterium]|nr:DUF58 domain-containing protein [bacterium]
MKDFTQRILKYIHIVENMNIRSSKVLQGLFAGLHRSPYLGFSADFEDHRQYNPGDNIKLINWPLWGRTEKLFIKRFKEDTNATVHIMVDSTLSMDYGKEMNNKHQMAKELAVLLYLLFTRQNDRVVLSSFSDNFDFVFSASGRKEHNFFIDTVSGLNPRGTSTFYSCMEEFQKKVKRRSIVILISDLIFSPDDLKKGLGILTHSGHDIIALQLLTAKELGVTPLAPGFYFDPEHRTKKSFSKGEDLQKRSLEWQQTVEKSCIDMMVKRIMISTASDPLEVLLKLSAGAVNGVS